MERFEEYRRRAAAMDRWDALKPFREGFFIPSETVYMDGNSLGLASVDSEESMLRIFSDWKNLGIGGWLEGTPPWFYFAEELGRLMAPLMGARPDEVIMTGSTTMNLHSLVSTFYHPTIDRRKIVADELNFPSDIYALRSQLKLKGMNPEEDLVLIPSRDGRTLDEGDIIAAFDETVSLVVLPSVLYRSGQLLDMERITREARKRGILVGFDCAHSAGALSHRLSEWDVDFAFWCGYKYLNGGPGCPAFIYINRRHFDREPGLAGWFGYEKDRQFEMDLEFSHARSAGGWQMGTPPLLSAAPLRASLQVFGQAGMERLRRKSLGLTSLLMELVDTFLTEPPYGYSIGTPREPERRGGHVAVEHEEAWRICSALKKRRIIPDYRPPNVIRLAPTALYNTFTDVVDLAQALREIIDSREFDNFPVLVDSVS